MAHEEEVVREEPPAHYAIRIESLSSLRSSLANTQCDDRRFSSTEFSSGGHNWVLIVDLNVKDNDKDGHISMYLKLVDKLKPGEIVNARFCFFVYNQKMDKYFAKQDMKVKRFSLLKAEWGIPDVLSLSTFNDPTKGYVINDCCVFGTEVFVLTSDFRMGTLVNKADGNRQYSWTVSQYSKLEDNKRDSAVFTFDGIPWTLQMYPRGDWRIKGKNISIYLNLGGDSNLTTGGQKVYVEYEITLKDQLGKNDIKKCATRWFQAGTSSWGWSAFLSLSDLKDPSKGYLLKDELIVEVNIKSMFSLQNA
ncbi:hypothetical protein Dimus_009860 [Dionaea muscipula]